MLPGLFCHRTGEREKQSAYDDTRAGRKVGGIEMRAVLYLRLSKEDKNDSIENQRRLLSSYCLLHGFSVTAEYRDEAVSGLSDHRPGFQQMLLDARDGRFEVIVAKNQSRFSRNFLHVEQYLHQELKTLGIRFIGVSDGVDTNGAGNKKARQIYALLNEWYCQDLSDNVRAVLQEKIRRGDFIGSFAPYGYEKDSENPHRLKKKEPQAQAVRLIFEGYAAGKSAKELAYQCSELELPAPDEKAGWGVRSIYRILENECYKGILVQGKSHTVSYKEKKRIWMKPDLWIRKERAHEAIISEELFRQVQDRKQKRGRKRRTHG